MRLMRKVPERLPGVLLAAALLAAAAPVVAIESAASPRSGPPVLRHVRSFESDATSAPDLGGFPFPPGARAHLDLGLGNTRALALNFPGGSGQASDAPPLRINLDDSINLAFASRPDGSTWWLLFDSTQRQLVRIADPGADAPGAPLVHRFDAPAFDVLQDPQGMTIDPDTGRVFILDAARRKIVLLNRLVSRGPRIRLDDDVQEIDLPRGLSGLRGIAFDPAHGHLHVLSPSHGELYELDGAGHLLALRDVSAWGTVRPDAMTFAASSRPSDDPARTSLFLLARLGSNPNTTLTEWRTQEPTAAAMLPASSEPATLVQTIDTSAFDPPSPDPSGLEYDSRTDSLLVTDGEVDEMSIYDGANVFKVSRSGRLLATFDTTRFSDEPAGLAIDPATRHCFVSDDTSPYSVYEVDPGVDGTCFTGDDTVGSFPTKNFSLTDPEGAAFGQGTLFLVDGMGYSDELFKVSPGPNGIFEGDEGDDSIAHCDTSDLGVDDPEGVAYDPGTGTLFVVGLGGSGLAQITPDCRLVRTIGHSGVDFNRPAGLALAPASANPSTVSLWVADRGVDNDSDSDENDGAIYELALPFLSPANLPPTVSAGPDLTIAVTGQARLQGSVADDGRPTSGPIGSTWSKVSGPGTVLFDDPHRATAYATFSAAGTYVLRLTGDDGELQASDDVTITVTFAGGGLVFETRVVAGADDAEEQPDGSVDRSSSDLDLVSDGSVTQAVGIRFHGVSVPPGARIVEAWIQFEADETSSDPTTLALRAEAADHASPFLDAERDISSRALTQSLVSWSLAAWPTVGAAGPEQRTPDLSAILQEMVNRPGWSSGNALAIVITGAGRRVAKSFEGSTAGAPLLHVGYVPVVDMAPIVTITAPASGTSLIRGDTITLQGVATDPEDGDLSASLTWTSSLCGTLGAGANLTRSDLPAGSHTITASVADTRGLAATASLDLTVQLPAGVTLLDTRIAAGADDAEESDTGSVGLTSSDLDLLNDGSANQRAAGLRFLGVGVPRGATIVEAWVQFQADETSSDPTSLVVQAEAADNAAPFASASAGISSRPRTAASVSWSPAAWPLVGAANLAERTPDLSAVIQEIVGRPGWSSGNALAIVISGTGRRVAESFEGNPLGAPLLHIGYSVEPNTVPVVTITAPANGASVTRGEPVTLQATATDAEDGDLSAGLSWTSNLDGPLGSGASLTRSNLSLGVHTVTASVADTRGLHASATLTLTVALPVGLAFLDTRIAAGADDAEESDTGSVGLTSSDLDLLNDGSANQRAAGLRFSGVALPRGATIVEAWVQFQADETSSDPTSLVVQAEAADNAAPFGSASAGISSRPRSAASVSWSPAAWTTIGAADLTERTPDLSAVIQEIVNRPGWSSGSALAIVITGTGRRVAESFEGSAAGATLLHVGYVPVNMPPIVTITAPANGASVTQGDPVTLQATATDAEDGDLSAGLTWTSDRDGTLGSGASLTLSNLSVGVHTITTSVTDTRGLAGTATLTLTVQLPAGLTFLDTRITVGADDAEESDIGMITLAGADLDLTLDVGSLETISQTAIGLRFPGLGVPRGATIVEAWVQFQADETGSDPTSLVVQGEAADNAAPFGSALGNISSRPRTAASVSWSPAAWTPIGAAGPAQRTPDLSAVIREIVNRPGWASGNALAIVLTGTGHRVAESFEGNALGAPLLHVGYVPVNTAPVVTITAPANGTSVTQGEPVTLQATATDAEDGDLSAGLTWTSDRDGPLGSGASLTRSNLSVGAHTITASVADTRGLHASTTLTLTVALPAGLVFLDTRIAAGADDAEESDTGSVGLTSSDLDLLNDGSANQRAAGLRFSGVALPRGATIVEAWVQFQADETSSDPTSLVVQAEAADNAAPFGSASAGISSRPRSAASVSWSPAAWTTIGAAGPAERTPDLSAVIQEIVNRPGWSSGSALAIVITGTGRRVAESFEGSALGASLLHVGYVPVNAPPIVTITAPANGASVTQGDPVTLQATATDAEDGDLSAGLTWTSDRDGTLGSGASLTLSNLSVGVHTITTSVTDTRGLAGTATLTLTVQLPAGLTFLDTRITVGADDAEESDIGMITLAGADLDLTLDVGSLETISQTAIGLRFPGLGVPRGATIVEAWVQFQADETGSDPTSLVVQGEAADNAAPFGSTLGNISSRPRTAASVSWSPAAWTPIGAAGPAQRTPDLSAVIREIVNRPGWASGNALAIVITGTGHRVAESFEGNALGAPLLHVGYVPVNTAPVVTITAPANGTSVTQGEPVTLQATATDAEDGDLSAGLTWTSDRDGPLGSGASLTRSNLSVGAHTITASVADTRGLHASTTLTLTVALPAGLVFLDTRIAAGADDAEESDTGSVGLTSSDLDLLNDGSANQRAAGLRFSGVALPRGATIVEAWVQFQADETSSDPTSLVVQAEAADNAAPFGSASAGISSRPRSAASVSWSPAAWTTIGAAGPAERTPDLSAVIQEIVNRPGWSSGSALAIVITGTGRRVAESFEGSALGASLLHVGYVPVNAPPIVTITAPANGASVTQGDPVTLQATATDAEDGDLSAGLTWTSDRDGTLGSGASLTLSNLSVGVHTITTSVTDTRGLAGTATLTLTVQLPAGLTFLDTRITVGADDAEESDIGMITLAGADLDLTLDVGSLETISQTAIGLRFPGLGVPRGATIVEAWVQFQADETGSDPTSLVVQGEAADNAAPFGSALGNISSRPRTAASVSWSLAAWTPIGAAGPAQRTSDLSAVIREIVNRPGWASGNALAIVITGTGHRVAESFEGSATGAPLLHVGYVANSNTAPIVTITSPANGTSVTQGDPVTLQATAIDAEDGDLSAGLSWTSNLDGTLGSGASLTRSNLSLGVHTITASVVDHGGHSGTATLSLTVKLPGELVVLDSRIVAGPDDAEESVAGTITLASSDLDLTLDVGSVQTVSQTAVGLRFGGISVPRGARIIEAWVQFQADETGSDPTALVVQGEAADNAAPFGSVLQGISSRTRTAATVSWSPAAWTPIGAAGIAQRTPDLSAVIQEIVNRPGWSSGNALAIVITGTGRRVAESFEGSAAGAPLLHVGYLPEATAAAITTNTARAETAGIHPHPSALCRIQPCVGESKESS